MSEGYKEDRDQARKAKEQEENAERLYQEALEEANKTLEDWRVLVKKN